MGIRPKAVPPARWPHLRPVASDCCPHWWPQQLLHQPGFRSVRDQRRGFPTLRAKANLRLGGRSGHYQIQRSNHLAETGCFELPALVVVLVTKTAKEKLFRGLSEN